MSKSITYPLVDSFEHHPGSPKMLLWWAGIVYLVVSVSLVLWSYRVQVKALESNIQQRYETALGHARLGIQSQIKGLESSMALFAKSNEHDLEKLLSKSPQNLQIYHKLQFMLTQQYSDLVGFSLAKENGDPIQEFFGGLIGESCKMDIKTFAHDQDSNYRRLHPNMFFHHIDIMSAIELKGEPVIFFANFKPNLIVNTLKEFSLEHLTLMLVHKEQRNLIELTPFGARNSYRRDWHLSEVELQSVVGEVPIMGSKWRLLALLNPDRKTMAMNNIEKDTIRTAVLLMLGGLVLMVGLMVVRQRIQLTHQELSDKHARMKKIAHHDPLTGLPNRMLLHARLQMTLDQALRDQSLAAVIFVDIDHFKQINDRYGHQIGDQLLIAVANRLNYLRSVDTVARYAGDEFVVVLAKVLTHQDVETVARQMLEQIHGVSSDISIEVPVTASVGIAMIPTDGGDMETLFKHADQAMYAAKNAGRDQFQFYRS